MTDFTKVGKYLKGEAAFLGVTLLSTVSGGVVGGVVGGILSLFGGVPVLQTYLVMPYSLSVAGVAAGGALLGFVTSFVRRMLA